MTRIDIASAVDKMVRKDMASGLFIFISVNPIGLNTIMSMLVRTTQTLPLSKPIGNIISPNSTGVVLTSNARNSSRYSLGCSDVTRVYTFSPMSTMPAKKMGTSVLLCALNESQRVHAILVRIHFLAILNG